METALLHLVFDIAAALFAQIAQNFREYVLQGVIAHLTGTYGMVAIVADVNRCAIKMTGVFCGVTIAPTEFDYIFLRTEYTGDDDLMKGQSLDVKAIEESLTDILKEYCSTWHQIRDAGVQGINMVIGIGTDIHEFAFARLCVFAVLDGGYAPFLSGRELDSVGIGEGLGIAGYRANLMGARVRSRD